MIELMQSNKVTTISIYTYT